MEKYIKNTITKHLVDGICVWNSVPSDPDIRTGHTKHSGNQSNIKKSEIVDENNGGQGSKIYLINAGDVFMKEPEIPCVFD